jgi:2-octaprenylphenol hydroxylase
MRVWDAEGTGHIEFEASDIQERALGYIFENDGILHAVRNQLSRLSVSVVQNAVVENMTNSGTQTMLTLSNGESYVADLVVAADGAASSLRSMASIPTKEWSYQQTAIVTTVQTELSHEFCAWQKFSESGPLAFLPLTKDGQDTQHSSIVWSLDNDVANQMLSLNDEDFCHALGQAFEYRLGVIQTASERHSFPLVQRHATRYFAEGLVLVGDAAHTIHPLAGQGVNLGLYDIAVLSDEIVRALRRGYALSDSALKRRYEKQRQSHNMMAMTMMEMFKRLFGSSDLGLRYIRNAGLNWVNDQAVLKRQFSRIAAGGEADYVL